MDYEKYPGDLCFDENEIKIRQSRLYDEIIEVDLFYFVNSTNNNLDIMNIDNNQNTDIDDNRNDLKYFVNPIFCNNQKQNNLIYKEKEDILLFINKNLGCLDNNILYIHHYKHLSAFISVFLLYIIISVKLSYINFLKYYHK